jgi:hypothetical protein
MRPVNIALLLADPRTFRMRSAVYCGVRFAKFRHSDLGFITTGHFYTRSKLKPAPYGVEMYDRPPPDIRSGVHSVVQAVTTYEGDVNSKGVMVMQINKYFLVYII